MILDFDKNISAFIISCNKNQVKMVMVGGGAVNFHGYQRHSADIDFWIDNSTENLMNLKKALLNIGFEKFEYPKSIEDGLQNISIKISPVSDIELITRFNPGKSFDEVWQEAILSSVKIKNDAHYRVIQLADLINSKLKSGRNKDLLDIQELKRIHNLD